MSPPVFGIVQGLRAPLRGLKLVRRHGPLLRIAVAPLIINMVLFGFAIAFFVANFDVLLGAATGFLEIGEGSGFWHGLLGMLASVARFLIGTVLALIFAIMIFFGFTMIGSVISAPFNEILSTRTEAIVLGNAVGDQGTSLWTLYREGLYAIGSELRRLSMYLSLAIPIFVIGWVPVIGQVIAPAAGFLLTVYFLAFDYTDPVMSRRHLDFAGKRRFLKTHRPAALGFGAAALVFMAIPFVNLLLVPIQVVTGTLLYLEWSGEAGASERS